MRMVAGQALSQRYVIALLRFSTPVCLEKETSEITHVKCQPHRVTLTTFVTPLLSEPIVLASFYPCWELWTGALLYLL